MHARTHKHTQAHSMQSRSIDKPMQQQQQHDAQEEPPQRSWRLILPSGSSGGGGRLAAASMGKVHGVLSQAGFKYGLADLK